MKILFHNYYNTLNINNTLFEASNSGIGDDLLKPFNILADVFSNQNIEIGTNSKIPMDEADAFVFIDYPRVEDPVFEYARIKKNTKLYLLMMESPIVNIQNCDIKLHGIFEKVFTWSDDLVELNPDKYKKINYSFDIPTEFPLTERSKFCTIVAGNKMSNKPNELYKERLGCIKWYEKNEPGKLDLYGFNWSIVKFNKEGFYGKLMNRINERLKLFKYNFSVYKGKVERKTDVLSQYKFCICFENVANQRGYITEKIFDCFFSGTIPVYKGANNVVDYIPASCFIDYNKFKSTKELDSYLSAMSQKEIEDYQQNILKYLKSPLIQQFSIDVFCNTLLNNIR